MVKKFAAMSAASMVIITWPMGLTARSLGALASSWTRCALSPAGERHERSRIFKIALGRIIVEKSPILKMFERPDWTLFRTLSGLQQKAGVTAGLLRRVVMKELGDNALDAGKIKYGAIERDKYFIEDDGPGGLDGTPKEIADLFSIGRPLRSSKLLRLPQRGALGNGLRVVAGAVLASEGSLVVVTRNKRIELRPESDGSTSVINVMPAEQPIGTRIEIGFGSVLPEDHYPLYLVRAAHQMANGGEFYNGRSSPFWYDAPQFHELLLAYGAQPVRSLVAQLDGCTGGKAGEIVAAAGLDRKRCRDLDRAQATKLLTLARRHARPVSPDRLGHVGRQVFPDSAYARMHDTAQVGAAAPYAKLPFVVEAWACQPAGHEKSTEVAVTFFVNRTPIAAEMSAWRYRDGLNLVGAGLSCCVDAPKKGGYHVRVNITTPHCELTSDGKEPDLGLFGNAILAAIQTAMRKAQRAAKHEPSDLDDADGELLPRRPRGPRVEADAIYRERVKRFCALIVRVRRGMDFAVGARGWCYILERHELGKGSFDTAEQRIADYRKSGDLPLNICAEDASRETVGLEEINNDSVGQWVAKLVTDLRDHAHERYMPFSLWDDLDVYVEVATEKLDLRNLFEPVCAKFHVPITNLKGWIDLNARAAMMRRFAQHEAAGRRCVLLLCGDHDPGGLQITDKMRSNLEDLSKQVGWRPDKLIILRFGLNADFIDRHGLTWIDNLETSSGGKLDDQTHPDHNKAYVQDYIRRFGIRKCEANALVVEPEIGRQLCRDTILQYIPADVVERYERKLKNVRKRLQRALRQRLKEDVS
jgi:hypothetical protein